MMSHNNTLKSNVHFVKCRKVKTPTYGSRLAAGIDFFVPSEFEVVVLNPNCDILIPSGIKCRIPPSCALIAYNKSGIAVKHKLIAGACVVDADYTGEIHLHLINAGAVPVIIHADMKIIQFVLQQVEYAHITVSDENGDNYGDEIPMSQVERGTGGFGSTGN